MGGRAGGRAVARSLSDVIASLQGSWQAGVATAEFRRPCIPTGGEGELLLPAPSLSLSFPPSLLRSPALCNSYSVTFSSATLSCPPYLELNPDALNSAHSGELMRAVAVKAHLMQTAQGDAELGQDEPHTLHVLRVGQDEHLTEVAGSLSRSS